MNVPPWIAARPRFRLFDPPSPFHALPRFSAALGGRADVWIKREDLLPLAFGGNKLRNLEFLLGEALAAGADTLVTSGRRWSNHCRLTAAAGSVAGLDIHLVLTGPPVDPPGPNQRLEELFGATVHVTATAEREEREAMVEAVAAGLRRAGRRPFVIGVGGSGVSGALGQVLAGLELAEQAAERRLDPAAVVLPTATGGTQAGLLAAAVAPVVGIAVAHRGSELRPAIERTLAGVGALAGSLAGSRVRPGGVEVDDRWLGGGYGVPTPEAEAAASLLARTEGVLVDPIYTAKALAGVVALVREGRFDGQSVVFWHAGGLPGLFESDGPSAPGASSATRG